MAVQTGSATVEYLPGSPEYEKIFQSLQSNWWKIAADKPDTATDEALFMAESPEQLRFQSDRTYAENNDTFVCFFYDSPLKWVEANGKTVKEIHLVTFLMPPRTESTENVRGFFMVSNGTEIGINEGLFTYYYPPEIASGFWDFLVH